MSDDFLEDLRDDHRNFEKGKLTDNIPDNPFKLFTEWYKEAFEAQKEANAMSVSTVNKDGIPSSRIVYLKEFTEEHFIFFTNYNSHKGQDIAENPNIACLFFWPSLEREVRIEGTAVKTTRKDSEEYFNSRPRESKIGAWASHQSQKLGARDELTSRIEALKQRFPNEVPCPEFWGGYRITPIKIEFWQGRPSRLHDRIVYENIDGKWEIYRLNP